MRNINQSIFLVFILTCLFSCQTKPSRIEVNSLQEAYAPYFKIGAALNYEIISEEDSLSFSILKKHFNTITPENIMKWMFIHPGQDSFNYKQSDVYVDLGVRNNMHTVGHTLVWHSQLAPWVNEIKDSSLLINVIDNHIEKIVLHHKGKIQEWDVVNEALNEDGSYRESHFYNVLGTEYLKQAFKKTAEVDPNVKLVYNDYNLWKPAKRAGAIQLVKMLNESNIKIDGIGMQGHYGLVDPSIEDVEASIIAFSELGLKVSFTELDLNILPFPDEVEGAEVEANVAMIEGMNPYKEGLPDSIQVIIEQRYLDLFSLFLKHEEKIDRVTFWGISDDNSWLNNWPVNGRTNYPLPFDRKKQAKPILDKLIQLTSKLETDDK